MIICTLIALAAGVACIYFGTKSSVYAANNLRSALDIKISYFTMKQRGTIGIGKLITNLTNDVNVIQRAFMQLLMIFIRGPLVFIGTIFVVWFTANQLFGILLFIIGILLIIVTVFSVLAYFLYGKVQRALDAVNTVLFDTLSGIHVIKAYHRMKEQITHFKKINGRYTARNKKSTEVIGALNPLTMFIVNVGIIATLGIGLLKVDTDRIQVGAILAFISYLNLILSALTLSTVALMQLARSIPSLQRLYTIFTLPKDIPLIEQPQPSQIENITFQNVTFSYDEQTSPQLSNIHLHIPFGQTVGIIGDIGSGKTTLLHLLTRLHAFQKGEIYINQQPITTCDVEKLRKQIAVVPQRTFLFLGSIEHNLHYGNPVATKGEMEKILEQFHAWSMYEVQQLEMEKVLKYDVTSLSYGQKQRVSMARAMIRQARIVLIDDLMPTLDFLTADQIRAYLKERARTQTLIIATSNIATVQHADQLVLLKKGRIIATGTHDELLQISPDYQQMYEAQQGGE